MSGPLKIVKRERFVQLLLQHKPQTEAYIEAGYNCKPRYLTKQASALAHHWQIRTRMDELLGRLAKKAGISRQWVIDKLVENVERSMGEKPVLDREGNETGEYQYDGSVANKALELLGKEIGMFVDRHEVDVQLKRKVIIERLTDEQAEQMTRLVRLVERGEDNAD